MKKFLVSLTVALGLMASACGGGSANCDALKKQCDACTNASAKSTCNTAYTSYTGAANVAGVGDTACKTLVDAKTYAADSTSCKAQ